jgi:hypothetical protein
MAIRKRKTANQFGKQQMRERATSERDLFKQSRSTPRKPMPSRPTLGKPMLGRLVPTIPVKPKPIRPRPPVQEQNCNWAEDQPQGTLDLMCGPNSTFNTTTCGCQ